MGQIGDRREREKERERVRERREREREEREGVLTRVVFKYSIKESTVRSLR